jgi:hypothetical protein
METEETKAHETIGAALAGAVVVILIYLIAITVWTTGARAGGYGEYSGQSWAERAMSGDHSRVRGKPQYEPGGYGYHRERYHHDRYSPGHHRISPRVMPHSHPHHRERGYSRVTHTHPVPVTHTHYYRPRHVHPRYTRHYYHWRPHYRPEYRRWQQYAWVKVPLYSNGYRDGRVHDLDVPERYRFDPDIRQIWERERREHLARLGYRDERRERYDGEERCKPPLKHFGETRMREDAAKAQAKLGWSAAVGLEYGLKYANIKHAKKRPGWLECHVAGYKEEGAEKMMDNFAKVWNRQEHWKSKCVVEARPCAPKRGNSDEADDSDDHDGEEPEVIERPGPTQR